MTIIICTFVRYLRTKSKKELMNKIFCLETEWDQTVHDLKKKSTVLSLLDFLQNAQKIEYAFRQVATYIDFKYYISHLFQPSYNSFDNIYLCFHGGPQSIAFANKYIMDLLAFAERHNGIFEGRNVHFGSCSTLRMTTDEVLRFKHLTKARMITGYTRNVSFTPSFIFEAWLLTTINQRAGFAGKRIKNLAEKEMPFYCNLFGFEAY